MGARIKVEKKYLKCIKADLLLQTTKRGSFLYQAKQILSGRKIKSPMVSINEHSGSNLPHTVGEVWK